MQSKPEFWNPFWDTLAPHRNSMIELKEKKEVKDSDPTDTKVLVLWGNTGSGKSHGAHTMVTDIKQKTGLDYYWGHLHYLWSGYQGETIAVIDDVTWKSSEVKRLKKWLSPGPRKVSGKMEKPQPLLVKFFIITSLKSPLPWCKEKQDIDLLHKLTYIQHVPGGSECDNEEDLEKLRKLKTVEVHV